MNVVTVARCPEHGLHGERSECYVCGGAVEQVAMVPVEAVVEWMNDHVAAMHHRYPAETCATCAGIDALEEMLGIGRPPRVPR